MKIVALVSENVKRLKAVSIKPDGSMVVIRGNNGAGKSSVLDSIAYALGGEKLACPQVVRRGEEQAEVTLDLGDLVVTRRWTASGKSTLAVKSPEGARYPSPQSVLDKLVGKLSFDPLAFTREKPAEQVEILRRVVGLDFSAKDEERKSLYDERTIVNRDVQILRGAISRMPEIEAPDAPVSVAALLAEQDRLLGEQKKREEAERAAVTAATFRQNAEKERDQTKTAVADLERRLAGARETLAKWEAHVEKTKGIEALRAAELEAIAVPNLDPVREQLRNAEGTNAQVRAKKARAVEVEKLAKKEAESANLSDRIARLDAEKEKALVDARFPVPGLSFTDAGVTLQGLPLEQASQAEQLRVSLAVGLALNPKLKVLLIRDGSLLDEDSMRLVAEMSEKADAQVWVEVVSKGGTGIVIEDGAVEGAEERRPRAEAAQ